MLNIHKINQLYLKDTQFANLMTKRIFSVLLIANPYDAFILEEDGRIDEKIFNEYTAMDFPNKYIHITTTPISSILKTATIFCKTGIIVKWLTRYGIRIKIIIHMNTINIITRNNVFNDRNNKITTLGQCRVKKDLITISDKIFGMGIIKMRRSQLIGQRCLDTIRIDPSMILRK